MIKRAKWWVLGMALMGFTACDSNRIYEHNEKVPNQEWNIDQSLNFEFEIKDGSKAVNTFLNLRHTADYPYRNFYVFTYLTYPDGNEVKDTVEIQLAAADGRWFGSGSGSLLYIQWPLEQNKTLGQSGKYQMKFVHAMRDLKVNHLVDVGFRVEQAE